MIGIIKKRAFGAIRVQLKYNELCTLKFPIPATIEEQRRVLEKLAKFDDEIKALEEQASSVLAKKQAAIDKIWVKE